jgi:hypothetical protein
MESAYDDGTAYGQIYKNGVAVGTQRTTSSEAGVWFMEDLSVVTGDTIELWIKTAGSSGDNTTYINAFQLLAHANVPGICLYP